MNNNSIVGSVTAPAMCLPSNVGIQAVNSSRYMDCSLYLCHITEALHLAVLK